MVQMLGETTGRECSIDELAAHAGVPTRTIREYQRLELLRPPRRQGRVGKYGPEHRARLSIIGRLQQRGYSLAAIGDLMGTWEQGRGLGSVLGVDANPAVLDETPTEISATQLGTLVPAFSVEEVVDQAEAAGLLVRINGDTIRLRSTAALELVGMAIEAGMPVAGAVAMARGICEGAATIAGHVVDEFAEHLWPRRDSLDLAHLMSSARLLLAQASASFVVHELALALVGRDDLEDRGQLTELVDDIAIGQIRRMATLESGSTAQGVS